jgi:uncharacterized delta-60 repeat protein
MQVRSCSHVWLALAATALALVTARHAGAASGDLDSSFGIGGKVTFDFAVSASMPDYANGRALARDGHGNVYVVGFAGPGDHEQCAIIKIDPNGQPISAFGQNGTVLINNGESTFCNGVAVDKNGNIFLEGQGSLNSKFGATVFELSSTGHPVTTFGSGGSAFIDFKAIGVGVPSGIAVDASDNVYITGTTDTAGTRDFIVVKLNAAGQPVSTFGTAGRVLVDFGTHADYGGGILMDTAGNVVLAGETDTASGASDMALVKLDSTGHLVTSFGTGGKTQVHITDRNSGYAAIAQDASGNLYASGYAAPDGQAPYLAVSKLDPNGHLITTFGDTGTRVLEPYGSSAYGLDVDSLGDVFVLGGVGAFTAIELDSAGRNVAEFGVNGVKNFCFTCDRDTPVALLLDGNTHVYVVGYTEPTSGPPEVIAVAKLNVSVPDKIFNNGFELTL